MYYRAAEAAFLVAQVGIKPFFFFKSRINFIRLYCECTKIICACSIVTNPVNGLMEQQWKNYF